MFTSDRVPARGGTGGRVPPVLNSSRSPRRMARKFQTSISGGTHADATAPAADDVAAADAVGVGVAGLRGGVRTRFRVQLQLQSASSCAFHLSASDLRSRAVEPQRRHAPDADARSLRLPSWWAACSMRCAAPHWAGSASGSKKNSIRQRSPRASNTPIRPIRRAHRRPIAILRPASVRPIRRLLDPV